MTNHRSHGHVGETDYQNSLAVILYSAFSAQISENLLRMDMWSSAAVMYFIILIQDMRLRVERVSGTAHLRGKVVRLATSAQ